MVPLTIPLDSTNYHAAYQTVTQPALSMILHDITLTSDMTLLWFDVLSLRLGIPFGTT